MLPLGREVRWEGSHGLLGFCYPGFSIQVYKSTRGEEWVLRQQLLPAEPQAGTPQALRMPRHASAAAAITRFLPPSSYVFFR
jgi:hypothetical protein